MKTTTQKRPTFIKFLQKTYVQVNSSGGILYQLHCWNFSQSSTVDPFEVAMEPKTLFSPKVLNLAVKWWLHLVVTQFLYLCSVLFTVLIFGHENRSQKDRTTHNEPISSVLCNCFMDVALAIHHNLKIGKANSHENEDFTNLRDAVLCFLIMKTCEELFYFAFSQGLLLPSQTAVLWAASESPCKKPRGGRLKWLLSGRANPYYESVRYVEPKVWLKRNNVRLTLRKWCQIKIAAFLFKLMLLATAAQAFPRTSMLPSTFVWFTVPYSWSLLNYKAVLDRSETSYFWRRLISEGFGKKGP